MKISSQNCILRIRTKLQSVNHMIQWDRMMIQWDDCYGNLMKNFSSFSKRFLFVWLIQASLHLWSYNSFESKFLISNKRPLNNQFSKAILFGTSNQMNEISKKNDSQEKVTFLIKYWTVLSYYFFLAISRPRTKND